MYCFLVIGIERIFTIPFNAEDPYNTDPAFLITSMPPIPSVGKKLKGTDPTSPESIGISSMVTITRLPAP